MTKRISRIIREVEPVTVEVSEEQVTTALKALEARNKALAYAKRHYKDNQEAILAYQRARRPEYAAWRKNRDKNETVEERKTRKARDRELARARYVADQEELTSIRRQTRLSTNGKQHMAQKRTYPDPPTCEICYEVFEPPALHKLVYHHWDDSNTLKGIWTCNKCHGLCEAFDHKENLETLIA